MQFVSRMHFSGINLIMICKQKLFAAGFLFWQCIYYGIFYRKRQAASRRIVATGNAFVGLMFERKRKKSGVYLSVLSPAPGPQVGGTHGFLLGPGPSAAPVASSAPACFSIRHTTGSIVCNFRRVFLN